MIAHTFIVEKVLNYSMKNLLKIKKSFKRHDLSVLLRYYITVVKREDVRGC